MECKLTPSPAVQPRCAPFMDRSQYIHLPAEADLDDCPWEKCQAADAGYGGRNATKALSLTLDSLGY